MFLERKAAVEAQMAELQQVMDTINYKCWYYETALKAGKRPITRCIASLQSSSYTVFKQKIGEDFL